MNRSTRNIQGNCLIQEDLLGFGHQCHQGLKMLLSLLTIFGFYVIISSEIKRPNPPPPPTYRNSSYLSASLRPSHSSCLLRLPHSIILPRCLGCLIEKACIIIHTYIVASQINYLNWQHLTREFVPTCFLNLPQLISQAVCVTFLNSGCD